jgi:hypothetical protein
MLIGLGLGIALLVMMSVFLVTISCISVTNEKFSDKFLLNFWT